MTRFQVRPIELSVVRAAARRFAQNDPATAERLVDAPSGYPCRLTLQDAPVGSRVLLFRHRPFSGDGPYAEEGPIFARPDALPAELAPNEIPALVARRPAVVVRRYDVREAIIGAEVVAGAECAAALRRAFGEPDTDFVHVRNAAYGCFLFRADRL